MPRPSSGIPDALILAHISDRAALSDDLWLLPPQVGMLLGKSTDQLKTDRADGTPPPGMKPWGDKGPVRYKLGSVRDVLLGPRSEEYRNRAEAKIRLEEREAAGIVGFATFGAWLDDALPGEEWPFVRRKNRGPVDFFKALGMGNELSDEDECVMLSLAEYLSERAASAAEAEAEAMKRLLLKNDGLNSTQEKDKIV